MINIKKFLKEIFHVLKLPEMLILPGNIAFFLFLSLIPIISLIGVIASLFSLSTNVIVNFINSSLPIETTNILIPFIDGSNLNTGNVLLIIGGFFIASNGADALIIAANTLYKVNNEFYIARKVKALFMTFWLMLLFIVVLVVLAFGNLILSWLLKIEPLGNFILNNYIIIAPLKYFIAFSFILFTIKILYTMAPNKNIKSKTVNRGSVFCTVMIMLVTSVYSFYVTNIAHYDLMYGSLASLAALMFLIYLISCLLVLGMSINYNYYLTKE